jgi:hypothetical protein
MSRLTAGDEHPFVIEREDGSEIADADTLEAARFAADFLLTEHEEEGPLTVRGRHSGRINLTATFNPDRGCTAEGGVEWRGAFFDTIGGEAHAR